MPESITESLPALREKVENLESRINAIHEGQKELRKDFTEHDKHCVQRWTQMETQMKGMLWGVRTAGAGIVALLIETVWRVIA